MTKFHNLCSLLCTLAMATCAFAQPTNDDCINAIDLTSSLGQGADNLINAGTFDNSQATTGSEDPTTGFDCFGEPNGDGSAPSLDNTLWFTMTGDGNVYYIEASSTGCAVGGGISNNDTQMAIYTGTCGALLPVACNEDFEDAATANYPAAIELSTVPGETYYILVDGFNFNGNLSEGEFCIFITQFEFIACNAPTVSGGVASSPRMDICEGENITITAEGALAPTEGALTGYAWVVSTMDLEGNPDFVVNLNYLAGLNVTPDVMPLSISPSNYGSIFVPGNTYYFTLVAFGAAEWIDPNQQMLISQVNLDAACTTLSNSVQINYFATADCPVAVLNVDERVLGMSVFPNPTQDFINLNINTIEYTQAMIMVSNVAGQAVQQQHVNLASGENLLNLDVSQMPTGVYMLSVETDSHQSLVRFLIW